ncbi:MAG: hypothetical protein A3F18_02230 [Legionellales bacterium RIFCSPHIGHO2_12_FULL_37_14]|nr:MAG: hypothetical protein A3F18_02230 [Legionellales bacterium RIFCSPHIGHO2_12_FULL_37_14]
MPFSPKLFKKFDINEVEPLDLEELNCYAEDAVCFSNAYDFKVSLFLTSNKPDDLQKLERFFYGLIISQYNKGKKQRELFNIMTPYMRLCFNYGHKNIAMRIKEKIKEMFRVVFPNDEISRTESFVIQGSFSWQGI